MQNKLFGTDGIRGTANVEPMTAATALKVGMAAGFLCTRGKHRHRVVIGKDTRLSGYMIEPALTSGADLFAIILFYLANFFTPENTIAPIATIARI